MNIDDIKDGQRINCHGVNGTIIGKRSSRAAFHAMTLITASASAQTPIHSASTAIVPKATRPMPVIASLIGASMLR
jgi:hypothetical protein